MIYTVVELIERPLLLVLAGMLVYRKLHRSFPIFFTYILTVLAVDVIRIFLLRAPWATGLQYFCTYWITEAVLVLLSFLALYEVFLTRLFPDLNTATIRRWLTTAAGTIVVGLFVIAPSAGPSRIVVIAGAATMSWNFCQVALLIFFGGLAWFMSEEWRPHELGIVGGFGFNAAVKLIATGHWVGNSYLSTKLDQLPRISYLIATLIWIFFLSKTEPVPEEIPITKEMAAEADRAYEDIVGLMRGKRRS